LPAEVELRALNVRAKQCVNEQKRTKGAFIVTVKISAKLISLALAYGLINLSPAQAATKVASRLQNWRATIAHTPAPGEGCFKATYPLVVWRQTSCGAASEAPLEVPPLGGHTRAGDIDDYALVSSTVASAMEGSFPNAKGLKSEMDTATGKDNDYTLQLNSNYMSNDPACASAADPSICQGWQQFAYSSTTRNKAKKRSNIFMESWLLNYLGENVKDCPSGWIWYYPHCYRNSKFVDAPYVKIKDLPDVTLSGTAVAGGDDTLVFVDGGNAYSLSEKDSVVYLANGWTEGEFNVFGHGGGSEAQFNTGTQLTVKIDVTNGTNDTPVCKGNDGTTGETNNLTLGKCKAGPGMSGNLPYVQFKESN
jgi:hypothetical protein